MKRVKEYRDLTDLDVLAVETVIDAAPSKLFPARQFKLVHRSAGWTPAGSAARWDDESYGVIFHEDGATHGQSFGNRDDAVARFNYVTGQGVV